MVGTRPFDRAPTTDRHTPPSLGAYSMLSTRCVIAMCSFMTARIDSKILKISTRNQEVTPTNHQYAAVLAIDIRASVT